MGQFGAGEPWGFGMPNRAEPFEPDETLWIEARYLGTRATLTLEGEFDMTGTRALWAHVNDAIKSRFDAIIVDAGGLKFIDSSGLLALIRAREAAMDAGMTFHVRDPSPALDALSSGLAWRASCRTASGQRRPYEGTSWRVPP
jgi:anti-anti-sigma factor